MAVNISIKNIPIGLKITAAFFVLMIANFSILVLYMTKQGPAALKNEPFVILPETATVPGIPDLAADLNIIYSEISKLIILPEGERPSLVNITDASKLKNQAFFANAQNGDVVLVFSQSKKAYLYRPSIKKLVEVSPITFSVPTIIPTPQI